MITIQQYVRPQTLEEAYQLNQNKRNRIIGGMLWLKMSNARIHTAIDLCDLGLNTIEESEDVFHIGAMVTLRDLELHEGLNRFTNGAVAKAVHDIVGTQFRNMATVGGSVLAASAFPMCSQSCWHLILMLSFITAARFRWKHLSPGRETVICSPVFSFASSLPPSVIRRFAMPAPTSPF
jgi:CO/xanthine dehydrogenase FAD-binding subunit